MDATLRFKRSSGDRTLKTAYIDQDKRLRVKDRTGDGEVRDDHQISRHPRHVHRGMYVNKSKKKDLSFSVKQNR